MRKVNPARRDAPEEFFFDPATKKLYLIPNTTATATTAGDWPASQHQHNSNASPISPSHRALLEIGASSASPSQQAPPPAGGEGGPPPSEGWVVPQLKQLLRVVGSTVGPQSGLPGLGSGPSLAWGMVDCLRGGRSFAGLGDGPLLA